MSGHFLTEQKPLFQLHITLIECQCDTK